MNLKNLAQFPAAFALGYCSDHSFTHSSFYCSVYRAGTMATPGNGGIAASPFFHPADHAKVTVQKSPGGTRRRVVSEPPDVKEKKSGLLGATANLMNAIVGSGIVGIPYAIREAGFCAGIFLVLLCALITEKSLRLLIATAKHVHCPTYETAMESAYGVFGFRFITVYVRFIHSSQCSFYKAFCRVN